MIIEICDRGDPNVVRSILAELPEWFGRPASLEAYVAAAPEMPMAAARTETGETAGFLSLRRLSPCTAEAHVLGVRRDQHRRGIGRALFAAAERSLAAEGLRFFTVKTVASGHPDPFYARTRRFYAAIGFEPLETFDTLWGGGTPCLLMIKVIEPAIPG